VSGRSKRVCRGGGGKQGKKKKDAWEVQNLENRVLTAVDAVASTAFWNRERNPWLRLKERRLQETRKLLKTPGSCPWLRPETRASISEDLSKGGPALGESHGEKPPPHMVSLLIQDNPGGLRLPKRGSLSPFQSATKTVVSLAARDCRERFVRRKSLVLLEKEWRIKRRPPR